MDSGDLEGSGNQGEKEDEKKKKRGSFGVNFWLLFCLVAFLWEFLELF